MISDPSLNNIVFKIELTNSINLDMLFFCTVPECENDGICSMRIGDKTKGFINPSSMRSFCEMYFSVEGHQYNISLSRKIMNIKGMHSMEHKEYIFALFKFYLEECNERWSNVDTNMFDTFEDDPYLVALYRYSGLSRKKFIKQLHHYENMTMFRKFDMKTEKIVNACFSYRLIKPIIFLKYITVLQRLKSDYAIVIYYHNSHSQVLAIRLTKDDETHLIKVNKNGSINQYSCTNDISTCYDIHGIIFDEDIMTEQESISIAGII